MAEVKDSVVQALIEGAGFAEMGFDVKPLTEEKTEEVISEETGEEAETETFECPLCEQSIENPITEEQAVECAAFLVEALEETVEEETEETDESDEDE